MADVTTRLENYLRGLAKRRKNSTVTADDAHRFLDRSGIPDVGRTKYINAVLNHYNRTLTPVGVTYSERPAAKRRTITQWEWQTA